MASLQIGRWVSVTRRRALWALCASGLAFACFRSAVPATPGSGKALTPGTESSSAAPNGAFRVVFAGPRGAVTEAAEISVVFDRPVHALETVESDTKPPFTITPAVEGSFHWVGSRAARFVPKTPRLPQATEFRVEVPAGFRALDGSQLGGAYAFEFETPRPKLVRSQPYAGLSDAEPGTVLELAFNQPIAPDQLRSAAKLVRVAGTTTELPFEVTRPDSKNPKTLRLRPSRPLPLDSAIELRLAASLRGSAGPLPAGVGQSLAFRTYGPLRVSEVVCDRSRPDQKTCDAGSGLALSFNNSVKFREAAPRIRVTPDPGLDFSRMLEEESSYLYLPGRFRAGTRYRVEVDAGVVDRFGQRLAKPFAAEVTFADYRPEVAIAVEGRAFAPGPLSVPIDSMNTPSYRLVTAALGPGDLSGLSSGNERDLAARLFAKAGASPRVVTPSAGKNVSDRFLLDVAAVLQAGRGAVGIAVQRGTDARGADAAILNVSDLAITGKVSRHGSVIWVTRRSDNSPVANAAVAVYRRSAKPAVEVPTNSDGLARLAPADLDLDLEDPDATRDVFLVARSGADFVYQPLADFIPSYRLDVPADFSGKLRRYGLLFTERGIYRPGDDAWVKGVIRTETPTGNAVPPEQAFELVVRSPSGQEIAKETVLSSAFGTFAARVRVPAGGELGDYQLEAKAAGKDAELFGSLQVAEFKPAELALEAGSDRAAYARGESVEFNLEGRYLYGAPIAKGQLELSVTREPTSYAVPGADGFVTDAQEYYAALDAASPASELRRETRQLGDDGRLRFAEKLALPGQRGPELVRLDAEVKDVVESRVATSFAVLAHPASYYVGVSLGSSRFTSEKARLRPELVALDWQGRKLAGKALDVELIERRWTLAREESGGATRTVSRVVDRSVSRCRTVSAAAPVSCELLVPSSGYFLVRVQSQEGTRRAESALGVYSLGAGEASFGDDDRRRVELVLDKKSYAAGERARVLVKSPYPEAEALITVERAGVYQVERRTFRGGAPTFEVPITEAMRPNAFVSVHLLPLRSGQAKSPVAEELSAGFRLGYAELSVSSEDRRLGVVVTPSQRELRPGAEIDVGVSVKDARGKAARAEVTLYAVDEGVLSLVGYRAPNPLDVFARPRPTQVATLETRDAAGRIVPNALGLGPDKGRDGGGGGDSSGARRDFRATAYYNPKLETDERGEARVKFRLPEGLTTYRIMAVAVGKDDRYGVATERVTTSKRLMARPALPRFVRAGDRFSASLVVAKKGLAAGRVRVQARFEGLTAAGELAREVDVPENGSVEVAFPVEASTVGTAKVWFEVTAGSERDQVALERRVHAPLALENAALYGSTEGASLEQLGALGAVRSDVGGLNVSLASTALVGLDAALVDLSEYPYECTEQLASRLLPLSPLRDLAAALGLSPPPDAARRLESAVAKLLARQRGDGGFAMWPEDERSAPWISPYAALALRLAANSGTAVPKPALDRAREYLRRTLSEPTPEVAWWLAEQAFAVDVLGELGAPDAGFINRLFAERARLPAFAKALLLHAAYRAKVASDVPTELLREVEAAVRITDERALVVENTGDEYAVLLDSPLRTQALVLRALLAGPTRHPMNGALVRGLLAGRRGESYRNTQEAAFALLALDQYRKQEEPAKPDFEASVLVGERRLGSARFAAARPLEQRLDIAMASLVAGGPAPLRFEKEGDGRLYYAARLRYARRELPRTPLDSGFFLEKGLRVVTPGTLATATQSVARGAAQEFVRGDLVLVDLTLVAPSPQSYVVIDDPLPAGFEAVDQSLATTARWLATDASGGEPGSQDCPDCGESFDDAVANDRAVMASAPRRELRDDRALFFVDTAAAGLYHFRYLARATTAGRYVVPPSRAENMYAPEVFGRTAAAEVTVR